jgi:hypothetical protein
MSSLDHFDRAILGLAILSTVLASSAVVLSLWNAAWSVPAVIPNTASPAAEDTAESKTAEEANSEEGQDKESEDKEKDEKSDVIDDAYKVIHQRYNRQLYKWEDFDPQKDAQKFEGLVFIVYHRHFVEPHALRPLDRFVEVHSENLKDVLRICLKHVDAVYDPKPLVICGSVCL